MGEFSAFFLASVSCGSSNSSIFSPCDHWWCSSVIENKRKSERNPTNPGITTTFHLSQHHQIAYQCFQLTIINFLKIEYLKKIYHISKIRFFYCPWELSQFSHRPSEFLFIHLYFVFMCVWVCCVCVYINWCSQSNFSEATVLVFHQNG